MALPQVFTKLKYSVIDTRQWSVQFKDMRGPRVSLSAKKTMINFSNGTAAEH
jgi:hypothetical protein